MNEAGGRPHLTDLAHHDQLVVELGGNAIFYRDLRDGIDALARFDRCALVDADARSMSDRARSMKRK
jgi:hypothetical protein